MRQVLPVSDDNKSATSDSNSSTDSPIAVSPGPLNDIHSKRPYVYKDNGDGTKNDGNFERRKNNNNAETWTDTASHILGQSCCVHNTYNVSGIDDEVTSPINTPPWMDWLWLCEGDGTGRRKRNSRRARLFLQQHQQLYGDQQSKQRLGSPAGLSTNPTLLEQDFARLHDDFFESLVKEQGIQAATSSFSDGVNMLLKQTESKDSAHAGSSVSSGVSSASSRTMETVANASAMSSSHQSGSSIKTLRKKHSSLKLLKFAPKQKGNNGSQQSRAGMQNGKDCIDNASGNIKSDKSQNSRPHYHRRLHHARVAPIEAYDQLYNPALAHESSINLETIMARSDLLNPSEYVHSQCILQKDKGRGEKLKTCISARGKHLCLEKLRDKMKLVLQVSTPSSVGGDTLSRKVQTGMKRKMAKISAVTASYVETRSMIELQLGFLSMQYGLLLHWDTVKTGKIVFICLRKMCHDSFYSRIPDLLLEPDLTCNQPRPRNWFNQEVGQDSRSFPASKQEASHPLVVRNYTGNHAIYQRSSGSTEVVLVDEPYRFPQPEGFAPSVLSLNIHQVTGLDHSRSQWTLSITFDGHTEIAHLQYNPETKNFHTTRSTPCKWEMNVSRQTNSFDLAGLEIRLFEQRTGRRIVGRPILGNHDFVNNRTQTKNLLRPQRNASSSSAGVGSSVAGSFAHNSSKPFKKSTSRLASTMTMPLGGLISQPSSTKTTHWKLTVPFTNNDHAQLALTLTHESDYAYWLYQELRARRREEMASSNLLRGSSSWSSSLLFKRLVSSNDGDFAVDDHNDSDQDDEDDGYWSDWLCGICC